jgi:CRP-like cAMP-binding protein
MPNAFVRKLDALVPLSPEDRAWLTSITRGSFPVEADRDLISEGDDPESVHIILEGLAIRYKLTRKGKRQIFAYLIPGDACDLHVALLGRLDHSIATVTPCQVVRLPPRAIVEMTSQHPAIARALRLSSLIDEATLREWLLNLGQRDAPERIAHLFCELHARMKAVELTDEGAFELPLTQVELGDTVGLSTVHVNRSLKDLREANLATMRNDRIVIPDVLRLRVYADFDPSYLHLRRRHD